ncbi:hypothetical protein PC118_g9017 [Phytophthora cactorum]|uniref:Uncharacterized protein n=1 Tax=Phytophthora cactorum TaxID=29920 RepID=A0A8T1G9V7_9STRA|nr:hypothetical protein PC112_g9426 [Phytophthora cactorum]KAG2846867.1 hypothetical protein PC111_g1038 [Phytophthora cactorum]KAG2942770.1 hypothetical protein PC115_g1257 [Phytophthora cactorum]KAG2953487.1 hypothetical protein PC117_g1935 [Phytophthora cactorum]KAG2984176.1 hypothetical protein PC118_g9017 [Phytophthora cactorum]
MGATSSTSTVSNQATARRAYGCLAYTLMNNYSGTTACYLRAV